MASLINGYLFTKVEPDDFRMLEMIYRLRYEVYAKECKYIREEDYPQETESDEYDEHSIHFAAINSRGMLIATARIILSDRISSPLLKHFPEILDQYELSVNSIAEISRFIISKKNYSQNHNFSLEPNNRRLTLKLPKKLLDSIQASASHCHDQSIITGGLCREMYYEMYVKSKQYHLKYWCALMERKLYCLLSKYGIKLECTGKDIDLFGPVRPYLAKISDFENSHLFKYQSANFYNAESRFHSIEFLNN